MILQKYFYCADLVQETLLLMLKTGVLLNIFVETMVHVFFSELCPVTFMNRKLKKIDL